MLRLARTTAVCVALLAAAGCGRAKPPGSTGRAEPTVTIRQTTWTVQPATTVEGRYRGLSGREFLAPGEGMLFVYPDSAVRVFCMRGCLIDIDIAFISGDMKVVKTYTMPAEPDRLGRQGYSSGRPARFVLEVAAGALARAGVSVGDTVTFSPSVPDPAASDP